MCVCVRTCVPVCPPAYARLSARAQAIYDAGAPPIAHAVEPRVTAAAMSVPATCECPLPSESFGEVLYGTNSLQALLTYTCGLLLCYIAGAWYRAPQS